MSEIKCEKTVVLLSNYWKVNSVVRNNMVKKSLFSLWLYVQLWASVSLRSWHRHVFISLLFSWGFCNTVLIFLMKMDRLPFCVQDQTVALYPYVLLPCKAQHRNNRGSSRSGRGSLRISWAVQKKYRGRSSDHFLTFTLYMKAFWRLKLDGCHSVCGRQYSGHYCQIRSLVWHRNTG